MEERKLFTSSNTHGGAQFVLTLTYASGEVLAGTTSEVKASALTLVKLASMSLMLRLSKSSYIWSYNSLGQARIAMVFHTEVVNWSETPSSIGELRPRNL